MFLRGVSRENKNPTLDVGKTVNCGAGVAGHFLMGFLGTFQGETHLVELEVSKFGEQCGGLRETNWQQSMGLIVSVRRRSSR